MQEQFYVTNSLKKQIFVSYTGTICSSSVHLLNILQIKFVILKTKFILEWTHCVTPVQFWGSIGRISACLDTHNTIVEKANLATLA